MSSDTPALSLAIQKLAAQHDLSAEEAEGALDEVMQGRASDVQKSALLMGLRAKGETSAEVAGGVRALRRAMVEIPVPDPDRAVDTCGTGGGMTTFNISTTAGFVIAAAGVTVAKHGNRSFSSRCGSADVLEALGVEIDLQADAMTDLLARIGLSFLFAPTLHPAMRHVAAVRRELAVPTIMNLLGPLTNPARVRRQVVGVPDPALLDLVAGALADLGHLRALVVHGEPGLDELSPLGVTHVVHVENGATQRTTFDPGAELGWTSFSAADLDGGAPDHNARITEAVLGGGGPPGARAAVALNAAAGLYVAETVDTLAEGVEMAESILDEKKGLEILEALRQATNPGDDPSPGPPLG